MEVKKIKAEELKDVVDAMEERQMLVITFEEIGDLVPAKSGVYAGQAGAKEEIYLSLCRELQAQGKLSLAPGAEEFLNRAKTLGYPMNIATSAQPGNVDYYFSAFGLERWFDRNKVSCLLPGIPGKPATDLYLRAAAAIEVDAKDCWVLEDAASGIQSAQNAGAAKIIAIGETEEARKVLEDNPLVEQVISDFREVVLPERGKNQCG